MSQLVSLFASGQIPVPPEAGSYFGDLTQDYKGFKVCTSLSDGSPFCIESVQGGYDEPVYSTPFMGIPPGSPTPTPTPLPSGPTPTGIVYGTPYLTPSSSANCDNTSIGLVPLINLGSGFYQGFQGGLYSGGSNSRPAAHDAAGASLADSIVPLDSAGIPDSVNGKYVLLSIGVSNTTLEFSTFKPIADLDPAKDPKLVIVDGAQSGQTAALISDPNAPYWTNIETRLATAGVTINQVAVAWVKETNTWPVGSFPVPEEKLRDDLAAIARNLKMKYPNIKLAYYSSRIYSGYAATAFNPETYAYNRYVAK